MKAPDKLYLQPEVVFDQYNIIEHDDLDMEYIRKDALIEWLERRMTKEGATEGFVGGYDFALKDVINKINSM